MSVQNPNIPTATQAKGIDLIVLDLQTHLDTELIWLTNGMGRAYRLSKVRTNQTTVFLPEVYLGVANRYDYFAATPDNDKQGQSIFFVGDATLPDQQKGFYGWVEHDIGIIFSANLELIDSALLVTEDFTEHLIQDVREALIRDLVGKSYRLEINAITRDFDDVYTEFDVARDRGVAHAPMTHFRVNCTVTFREDCTGVSLDRCAAILQNLSSDDKLNCILPTYDFSSTTTQNALTNTQVTDLTDWICSDPPSSMYLDGVGEYIKTPINSAYDFEYNTPFTISLFVKIASLKINILFDKRQITPIEKGYLGSVTTSGKVLFELIGSGFTNRNRIITVGSIAANTWTRIDFVFKGSPAITNLEVCFDGVKQAVTSPISTLGATSIINNENLKFGINKEGSNSLDGYIHEVQVRDIALSTAEIIQDRQDILDFNNGVTSSYTPVRSASLVLRNRTGVNAVYGGFDWAFPDDSSTIEGMQSVLMEFIDKKNDIPL